MNIRSPGDQYLENIAMLLAGFIVVQEANIGGNSVNDRHPFKGIVWAGSIIQKEAGYIEPTAYNTCV